MPSSPRRRASTGLVRGVLSLSVVGVASCGFDAPTDQVYTPAEGANSRRGTVDVLNALVVSGDDGSGTLVAALVNNDTVNDDALVGIRGVGEYQSVTVDVPQTEVPAGQLLQLADDGAVGVNGAEVLPGSFVTLKFDFERGTPVSLNVPVVGNEVEGDYADVPQPSESPTESPSESPTEEKDAEKPRKSKTDKESSKPKPDKNKPKGRS